MKVKRLLFPLAEAIVRTVWMMIGVVHDWRHEFQNFHMTLLFSSSMWMKMMLSIRHFQKLQLRLDNRHHHTIAI